MRCRTSASASIQSWISPPGWKPRAFALKYAVSAISR
jgi:hypothetical protein